MTASNPSYKVLIAESNCRVYYQKLLSRNALGSKLGKELNTSKNHTLLIFEVPVSRVLIVCSQRSHHISSKDYFLYQYLRWWALPLLPQVQTFKYLGTFAGISASHAFPHAITYSSSSDGMLSEDLICERILINMKPPVLDFQSASTFWQESNKKKYRQTLQLFWHD